jgi:hypothetical protein
MSPLRVIQTERMEKTRGISLGLKPPGVTRVSARLTLPLPLDRLPARFSDRDTDDLGHLVASLEDHALCCCERGADEAGDRFFGQTRDEAGLAEQKNGHGEGKTAKQDQPVSDIETKYPLVVNTDNHDCSDGA